MRSLVLGGPGCDYDPPVNADDADMNFPALTQLTSGRSLHLVVTWALNTFSRVDVKSYYKVAKGDQDASFANAAGIRNAQG